MKYDALLLLLLQLLAFVEPTASSSTALLPSDADLLSSIGEYSDAADAPSLLARVAKALQGERQQHGARLEDDLSSTGSPTSSTAPALRLDDVMRALGDYRRRLERQDNASTVPSRKGYDLCAMCQAMYHRGECTSRDEATRRLVETARAQLSADNPRIGNLALAAGTQNPHLMNRSIAHARELIGSLQCPDDAGAWWRACSRLSCMNGMADIDSTCKYRIAPLAANPLGGSEAEAVRKVTAKLVEAQRRGVPLQDVDDSGQSLPRFLMYNDYHSHCGSGFDARVVGMSCHFPSKLWCTKLGGFVHARECAGLFCGTQPCLWTCTPSSAEEASLSPGKTRGVTDPLVYEAAHDVLDAVLPHECQQEVDGKVDGLQTTTPDGTSGRALHLRPTRNSVCANPITGEAVRMHSQ